MICRNVCRYAETNVDVKSGYSRLHKVETWMQHDLCQFSFFLWFCAAGLGIAESRLGSAPMGPKNTKILSTSS